MKLLNHLRQSVSSFQKYQTLCYPTLEVFKVQVTPCIASIGMPLDDNTLHFYHALHFSKPSSYGTVGQYDPA